MSLVTRIKTKIKNDVVPTVAPPVAIGEVQNDV